MTSITLARAYLIKAQARLKVLDLLLNEGDFSDVVREAQELVELAAKGMLRHVGIEPSKWHDVGGIILDNAAFFAVEIRAELPRLAEISRALRKERELSFYGDEDFVPTAEYDREFAQKAVGEANFVYTLALKVIGLP